MICMIAVVGKNNELGNKNSLLWHLPNDLAFFKKVTLNHPVLMGQNTYLSIGRLLPNRTNIIITNEINVEGAVITTDLEGIIKKYKDSEDELYIIGGASMYNYFINYADKLYLTEVPLEKEADVYFPKFDKNNYIREVVGENNDGDIFYKHVLYKKKK